MALISIEPNWLIVPQNTLSPMLLSTGSDSPVIIDWSTEVSPSMIIPSTGIVSPGRMRIMSSVHISFAEIISSLLSLIRLPCVGARLINFLSPFFALSVVISSRIAPNAIMKATSPAAKRSPIAMAAIIAMEINKAEDILLIPGL